MKTDLLTIYTAKGFQAKRKTADEYSGPCPWCGGTKRFQIFKDKGKDGLGRFWCRECRKQGDTIQFLRDLEGMSFKEAQEALGLDPNAFQYNPVKTLRIKPDRPEFSPALPSLPGEVWQEKAGKLVTWAAEKLMDAPSALSWLAESRGLTAPTVAAARLGWIPKDIFRPRSAFGLPEEIKENGKAKRVWIPKGLCIPVFHEDGRLHRVKIRLAEQGPGRPKYIGLPQEEKNIAPLVLEYPGCRHWQVVESELDAFLLFQESRQQVNVIAMGSASNRPDALTWEKIRRAFRVLVSLDYDEAGSKAAYQWWKGNLPPGLFRHWPVPEGKDPTDAWLAGWRLFDWIKAGIEWQ